MKSIGDLGGDLSNGEIYLAINKVEGSGGQMACGDVSASDFTDFPPVENCFNSNNRPVNE